MKGEPRTPKKPLPALGPVAYAQPDTPASRGERRIIMAAEMAVGRGDFSGAVRAYAKIRKDGPLFLSAASVTICAAIGVGDENLFNAVLADVDAYPERYGTAEAKLGSEIFGVWVRQVLWVAEKTTPSWLAECDLSTIPLAWRYQVGYILVRWLTRKCQPLAASVLADALLNLAPEKRVRASAPDIHLKMAKAIVHRLEGRMDLAEHWCRETVKAAAAYGFVFPFLGLAMGPKSVLEKALGELAPDILKEIKSKTTGYFRNTVRFHNLYTGESISEELTPREVFLACSLKSGLRYKEIAERLGVAPSRVNGMVKVLYGKLNVHNIRQMGAKIW